MKPESPYLTVDEAVTYLNLSSRRALYDLRYRLKHTSRRLRAYRGVGGMRFKQCDLDAVFEREPAPASQLRKVG